jgi:hypothetical protein
MVHYVCMSPLQELMNQLTSSVKLGMSIVPLEAILPLYILIS